MAEEKQEAPASAGKNIGMGVLCYLGILVLIPLLTDAKNDPFVKFHIKQGIVLLIVDIIVSFITWIPFIGWILGLALFVLWIIGLVNVIGGKEEKLPIIGQFGDKINI